MRYLVDTDWLIDALVGIPEAVATLEDLTPDGLGMSIVSVGEIYEGAYRGSDIRVSTARSTASAGVARTSGRAAVAGGSNVIRSLLPRARAIRCSVSTEGLCRPLSRRAICE